MLSPAHLSEVRATYLRLRDVQRALNTTLFRTVSKRGIEESARALGFWERGKLVLDEEDDVGVLMDLAICEYRAGGKIAVERYLGGSAAKTADERTVLEAMLEARFTLVEVEAVVPEVGARSSTGSTASPYCSPTWGCPRPRSPGSCSRPASCHRRTGEAIADGSQAGLETSPDHSDPASAAYVMHC